MMDCELKSVDKWTYEAKGEKMFLPFFGRIPDSFRLRPGDEVTLEGRPFPDTEGFSINLTMPPVGEDYNCALHFNPRLKKKRVVRDHRLNRHWIKKETYGGFPFQADREFKIVIKVHEQGYKISVDGTHFCDFTHKVHPSEITHVCLRGHFSVSLLRVHFDSSSREDLSGDSIQLTSKDETRLCDSTQKVHPSEVTHAYPGGHPFKTLNVRIDRSSNVAVSGDSIYLPHKSEKAKNSEQFDSSELKWTLSSGQTVTQAQDSV